MDVKVKHDLTARALVELLHGDAVGVEDADAHLGDLLRDLDHVSQVVGCDIALLPLPMSNR